VTVTVTVTVSVTMTVTIPLTVTVTATVTVTVTMTVTVTVNTCERVRVTEYIICTCNVDWRPVLGCTSDKTGYVCMHAWMRPSICKSDKIS
jgi:hypothetical protein